MASPEGARPSGGTALWMATSASHGHPNSKAESETIAAEGRKWIEVAPNLTYGHAFGFGQVR